MPPRTPNDSPPSPRRHSSPTTVTNSFLTAFLICCVLSLFILLLAEWIFFRPSSPKSPSEENTGNIPLPMESECPKYHYVHNPNCPTCSSGDSGGVTQEIEEEVKPDILTNFDSILYDATYWKYQAFGSMIRSDQNSVWCSGYTNPSILDYDCVGGLALNHLLSTSSCKSANARKDRILCHEKNDFRRDYAASNLGLRVVGDLSEVSNEGGPGGEKFDIVFATGVGLMEHDCALCEMRRVREVVKEDRGVFVVMALNEAWKPNFDRFWSDYASERISSWSAQTLGNVMQKAGFHVCGCYSEFNAWANVNENDYKGNKCTWCKRGLQAGKKNNAKFATCVAVLDESLCPEALKKLRKMSNCGHVC